MPFKHIHKRIHIAKTTFKNARLKANGSENYSSSIIAALEAMSVPTEFSEVQYNNILKKLPEQVASQSLVDEHG